jgi:hypothetical protein
MSPGTKERQMTDKTTNPFNVYRKHHVWHVIDLFAHGYNAENAVFPRDYVRVAVAHCDTVEAAYRLTNSIDCGWWDNEMVDTHFSACTFRTIGEVTGTRSTSVGDVVQDPQGRLWRCASMGWTQFEYEGR